MFAHLSEIIYCVKWILTQPKCENWCGILVVYFAQTLFCIFFSFGHSCTFFNWFGLGFKFCSRGLNRNLGFREYIVFMVYGLCSVLCISLGLLMNWDYISWVFSWFFLKFYFDGTPINRWKRKRLGWRCWEENNQRIWAFCLEGWYKSSMWKASTVREQR